MPKLYCQTGFSLLELITVIVLLGILAAGAGMLISNPLDAYDDQVRRQQLVDQGEMALRQIARDVRRALPNSLRITAVGAGFAVEMVNTVDGARYRDENDPLVAGAGAAEILDFAAGDTDFNLLGGFSTLTALGAGQRLVIYNTSAATLYQDAALNNNPGIITPAAAALTLSASPTYASEQQININNGAIDFQFAQQSPGQRVFVVDGPTSYICNPGTGRITRYSGYAFSSAQPTPPVGGSSDDVVSRLTDCAMSYSPGSAQRGGILSVELTLSDSGESISLLHQIHVVNVP